MVTEQQQRAVSHIILFRFVSKSFNCLHLKKVLNAKRRELDKFILRAVSNIILFRF